MESKDECNVKKAQVYGLRSNLKIFRSSSSSRQYSRFTNITLIIEERYTIMYFFLKILLTCIIIPVYDITIYYNITNKLIFNFGKIKILSFLLSFTTLAGRRVPILPETSFRNCVTLNNGLINVI